MMCLIQMSKYMHSHSSLLRYELEIVIWSLHWTALYHTILYHTILQE